MNFTTCFWDLKIYLCGKIIFLPYFVDTVNFIDRIFSLLSHSCLPRKDKKLHVSEHIFLCDLLGLICKCFIWLFIYMYILYIHIYNLIRCVPFIFSKLFILIESFDYRHTTKIFLKENGHRNKTFLNYLLEPKIIN